MSDFSHDFEQASLIEQGIDFCNGVVHSGLERPLYGAAQVADKMFGLELPKLDVFEPERHSMGATVGNIVGSAIPYTALVLIMRNNPRLALNRSTPTIVMAATGAAFEGILQPTDPNSKTFVIDRLKNATTGALTFGTMGYVAAELGTFRALSGNPAHALSFLGSTARSTMAGSIAGVVHAESNALLHEGRLATYLEIEMDALKYAVIGTGVGSSFYSAGASQIWAAAIAPCGFVSMSERTLLGATSEIKPGQTLLGRFVEEQTKTLPPSQSSSRADDAVIQSQKGGR
ncbi:MAG: hypothetical protein K2Z81_11570 [Cyanobacteria bacterium]|nr:hypothetical protein [Cyanobacteriota bacterium]